MKSKIITPFVSIFVFGFFIVFGNSCKKDPILPSVKTAAITSITKTSAISGGNITSDGGAAISARGICWNNAGNPTITDSKISNGAGVGEYTSQILGLIAGKTYHVRAYATNSVGTAYGEDISFSTSKTIPVVVTAAVTSITKNTAICGGSISTDGGDLISAKGVCWSKNANPTTSDSKTNDGTGISNFSSNLLALDSNTTYYVRAYATNSEGTAYGENIQFTTASSTAINDNDHLLLGNPSLAIAEISNANNFLMIKSQYCLSYNNTKHTANWTSWHLYSGDIGSTDRQDDFRPDETLPSSWYHVTETEFSGSGFDRGHLCPSADRTLDIPSNSATFLMTNMIPQAPKNNQITWANLENYSRSLVSTGSELYVIAGPYGQGGSGSNGYRETVGNGVVVPNKTWKIIVVIPNGNNDLSRISTSTRVIAVLMPNDQTCADKPWQDYRVSVDSLETLTGYDFLSNVSTSIQGVIEAKVDNVAVKKKK